MIPCVHFSLFRKQIKILILNLAESVQMQDSCRSLVKTAHRICMIKVCLTLAPVELVRMQGSGLLLLLRVQAVPTADSSQQSPATHWTQSPVCVTIECVTCDTDMYTEGMWVSIGWTL